MLDNWVEDGFGAQLHHLAKTNSTQRIIDNHYTSTQRASHIDPALMSYHPNILKAKIESAEDVMARNKEGMPYDLLFSYSNNSDTRFQSTMQAMQIATGNKTYETYARVDGVATREREKQVKRELKDMQSLTSESRQASRRIDPGSNQLHKAIRDQAEMPNFARSAQVSQFFTDANIPIVNHLRRSK